MGRAVKDYDNQMKSIHRLMQQVPRRRAVRGLIIIVVVGVSLIAVSYVIGNPAASSLKYLSVRSYKDPVSGLTFSVASDGRHISAVNAQGGVVWKKDPFVSTEGRPYQLESPGISYMGACSSLEITFNDGRPCIAIGFRSLGSKAISEGGVLDTQTGTLIIEGAD